MAAGVVTQRGTVGAVFAPPPSRFVRARGDGETTITLRGTTASLLWGHQQAVTIRAWAIFKVKGKWILSAKVTHANAYQARQRPLLFAAPRPGGFWAWPLDTLELGADRLRAELGPPER